MKFPIIKKDDKKSTAPVGAEGEDEVTYTDTFYDELAHAKLRLARSSKEGRWVIKQQIRQIKRDIRCNSMKTSGEKIL